MKYNLHYGKVRGDALPPPHGTNTDDSKLIRRVKAIEHVNRKQVSLNNSVIWADLWDVFYNFKNATIYILEINLQIQNIQWGHQMGQ